MNKFAFGNYKAGHLIMIGGSSPIEIMRNQGETAPLLASLACARCGHESRGRCCLHCWERACIICGQVILRVHGWHADHRGARHHRCEKGKENNHV